MDGEGFTPYERRHSPVRSCPTQTNPESVKIRCPAVALKHEPSSDWISYKDAIPLQNGTVASLGPFSVITTGIVLLLQSCSIVEVSPVKGLSILVSPATQFF